jgi:hypothetical protein
MKIRFVSAHYARFCSLEPENSEFNDPKISRYAMKDTNYWPQILINRIVPVRVDANGGHFVDAANLPQFVPRKIEIETVLHQYRQTGPTAV